jgi:divalent metal cation (Fe/Co/Zn/Cd) transporter
MIFALGGAMSIYEGILRIRSPEAIGRPWVNYVVIGVAVLFEGASFLVAWKEFRRVTRGVGLVRSLTGSKDPSVFSTLMEDSAALAGLVVAAVGVFCTTTLHWAWADGAASVVIGLMLVLVAGFLANETRSLLTGEAASPRVVAAIREVLERDPRVKSVGEVLSMHLGPREILVGVTLDFADRMTSVEIGEAADDLSRAMQACDDRITRVFLRSARGQGQRG